MLPSVAPIALSYSENSKRLNHPSEIGSLLALPAPSDPAAIEGQARPVAAAAPLADALSLGGASEMPRFMTPKQAADYLSVNPRLLENWRWKRCGPRFVKVGNSVRYTREDLDGFILL